ncbi:hypothetical protein GCM10009830_29480 [Glycomyces endophyticus]|uniref:Uncharacterized protein n=1 Tax=Glycomyces endophyticus TaxID=480996 RepID=A0ABN2H1R4_9ACTN
MPILCADPAIPAADMRETAPHAAVRMTVSSAGERVTFDISVLLQAVRFSAVRLDEATIGGRPDSALISG